MSSTISPRLVTPPSTTSQLLRFYPKTPQCRGKPTGFLSLLAASPRDLNGYLYETVYCARGRSEGFIKNHKTFLHSDRTSCHRFSANQFRLFLHSAAYVLLHTIQQLGLRGTQWTTSNFDTIQLRLLKIGARVREQATKVRFHFPTSYPLQDLMRTVGLNLDTS